MVPRGLVISFSFIEEYLKKYVEHIKELFNLEVKARSSSSAEAEDEEKCSTYNAM